MPHALMNSLWPTRCVHDKGGLSLQRYKPEQDPKCQRKLFTMAVHLDSYLIENNSNQKPGTLDMNAFQRLSSALLVMLGLTVSLHASANAVDVSYVVTGSTGDWTLDFSVTNNLNPSTMDVYFFGVQLSQSDIVASPSTYSSSTYSFDGSYWDNAWSGGSSIAYNNSWIDWQSNYSSLLPGQTLDGFKVHITDLYAPSDVNWFAYGYAKGAYYVGTDYFNTGRNPGFEGVAHAAAPVPEPETWAMLGAGMLALALARRRRSV